MYINKSATAMMETKKVYAIVYIVLLNATVPALCLSIGQPMANMKETVDEGQQNPEQPHHRVRRFAIGSIAVYAGVAVSPWVWVALIAVYGAALLSQYNVSQTSSDSHSCANNRGWCRSSCFSHEYVDWYNTPVCGYYYCCRSN